MSQCKEFSKVIAGLRLQARGADSLGHTGNIAWRGSQGRPGARPALEGHI
jgi:hypothetical protein